MEYLLKPLNSFIVIIIVGALVLLSFILVSNVLKVNRKANIFFGVFLLIWTSFWFDEILALIHLKPYSETLDTFLILLQLFVPTLFYYSVLYFTNPYRKIGYSDSIHLVVPFLALLNILFKIKINSSTKFIVFLLLFQALFYTIWSFVLLKKHEKRIEFFNSSREAVDLKWIKQIIAGLVCITVFITLYNLALPEGNLNIYANCLILLLIFFIAYHAMSQKEIFIVSENDMNQILDGEDNTLQNKPKLIPGDELLVLKEKLVSLMEKHKPYLEGDLSLPKLAEYMQLSPHHLSYLLNEGFNKNFFQLINSYRVEESKKLLLSKDHDHLSILGIAYEAGFNSKTAFNNVFKKNTGTTPTEYKKNGSHR